MTLVVQAPSGVKLRTWPFARATPAPARRAGLWLNGRAVAEYAFVDEWDVRAPLESVFDTLADGRTYPEWWTPVYKSVVADGPPRLGGTSSQRFKGKLPYTLNTRSTITRLERPHLIAADVVGDLSGHGLWTLSVHRDLTHVRLDWVVRADRPLIRMLTPIARPLFRWNHTYAIARAMDGLEPYAQRVAAA